MDGDSQPAHWRWGFGRALLTIKTRPLKAAPFSALTAFATSSGDVNSTNPYPRERPVRGS